MDAESPETREASAPSYLHRALSELGLISLYHSPLDTKLLCTQRFVRLFAYGCSTLVLVSYLTALGFSEESVGLFMTLTLIGDVCVSFLLTVVADGLGRKAVLALGALLMSGSGVTFALSGNYWILLTASILGVISPSGNEIGPFRAVEESTIAWITPREQRSDIYAWYALFGTSGTALGAMASGWIYTAFVIDHGLTRLEAYRSIFFLYAALGILKFLLAISLSRKCEIDKPDRDEQLPEARPLLAETNERTKPRKRFSLWPTIARSSYPIVLKLLVLFGIDTFASGLVSSTWVVYFYKTKFNLPESTLGTIFFTTGIIAAGSMLVASSIAKRFGNIKTMVFTHMPSAIFLALIPIPASLPLSLTFLILRACSQSMDTAPRSAFLATVLKPNERTATMGFLNIGRTVSTTLPPLITGVLASRNLFWIAFVVAGSLKVTYDIGMLIVFLTAEAESERAEEEARSEQQSEESS